MQNYTVHSWLYILHYLVAQVYPWWAELPFWVGIEENQILHIFLILTQDMFIDF